MKLEELFEDDGKIVNSEGFEVDVELVDGPKIFSWSEIPPTLERYMKRAPTDADAFVRGDMDNIRKRIENIDAAKYWPPLAPVYAIFFFEAVQYLRIRT